MAMGGIRRRPTVLVADDHPAIVEGLVSALPQRCGADVVGACVDGQQALEGIERLRPDVAMLDLRMPGLDGLQVLRAVVERRLATRVLVCSNNLEPRIVLATMQAGAAGYLPKEASWEEIRQAIDAAVAGATWVSPRLQSELHAQLGAQHTPLSRRELEILALAAEGLTNEQIAARLFIGSETVRTNFKRIGGKLGVSRRPAMVATAMRQGLLE